MNMKWIAGAAAILVAIAVGMSLNFGDNVAYFYVPKEVTAKAAELKGKTIKVGAMVKKGTVDWKPKELSLKFVITDFEGNDFKVSHNGVKPDMFKEGQGVVVEGRLNENNELVARNLIVKHSEEYRKPDSQHSQEKELLEKSIFKAN